MHLFRRNTSGSFLSWLDTVHSLHKHCRERDEARSKVHMALIHCRPFGLTEQFLKHLTGYQYNNFSIFCKKSKNKTTSHNLVSIASTGSHSYSEGEQQMLCSISTNLGSFFLSFFLNTNLCVFFKTGNLWFLFNCLFMTGQQLN